MVNPVSAPGPGFAVVSYARNSVFTVVRYLARMATFVLRLWLPDRPGALGAVASRVGSIGADVVGIDILEQGAGRAIDELIIELPDASLAPLLIQEVQEVDGVDVEDLRPAPDGALDPRLDALETAATLVGAATSSELLRSLCDYAASFSSAGWAAIVGLDGAELVSSHGAPPGLEWLLAFIDGSRTSARLNGGAAPQPDDIVWVPLASAGMALVLGREGRPFRARERREVAALARIVDSRFRELRLNEARQLHPATGRMASRDGLSARGG